MASVRPSEGPDAERAAIPQASGYSLATLIACTFHARGSAGASFRHCSGAPARGRLSRPCCPRRFLLQTRSLQPLGGQTAEGQGGLHSRLVDQCCGPGCILWGAGPGARAGTSLCHHGLEGETEARVGEQEGYVAGAAAVTATQVSKCGSASASPSQEAEEGPPDH